MKKSIKQLLSVVLVIAMMASLLVVPAAAADPQPGEVGYVWDLDKSEADAITGTISNVDYDSLTLTGKFRRQSGHGVQFYTGGTPGADGYTDTYIEIPVPGNCTIVLYTNYKLSVYLGEAVDASKAVPDTDKVATLAYTGEAGKVKLRSGSDSNCYVTKIEIAEAQADDEYTITAPSTAVIKLGESVEVAVSANKDGEVYATTDDTGIITLSEVAGGKLSITGEKAGEATVTLGVKDGKGSAEIKVTVYEPVTGPVTKWDFSAVDFSGVITKTDTEYNGLKLDGVQSHNGKYAYFNQNATLDIPVDGPCAVIVNCEYGNHGTVGVGEDVIDLVGDNDKNIDTTVYYYTGEAGYVTVTRGNGDLYLTGIELATSVWDFSAADFQGVVVTDTEYNGLTLENVKSHNGKYAHFGTGATMDIPVPGPCNVTVNCEYGNGGTVGVGEDVIDLEGDNDAGIDTTVYHYAGPDAGTVTVTYKSGNLYLTSVSLGAYTNPAVQIALSAEKANLELGGQAVEITAEVVNGTADGDMTAAVAEGGADMVTAAVAEGKITLTPGTKAGKTTVTVSVPAKNSKGESETVTAEIAVTVIDPNVTPTEWDFRVSGADELPSAMRGLIVSEGTSSKPPQFNGSTYGVYFFIGNYIDIPVEGPSKITVTGGYEWYLGMGSSMDSTLYGYAEGKEKAGEDGYKVKDEFFTYTGGKGYARLSSVGKATSYVAAIKVEPLDITPNSVDVWDFGAEALDTALFVNKLTVDIMNAWYPDTITPGSLSSDITVPVDGFEAAGMAFHTDGKTNHRLRTDNEAITRHSSQTKLGGVGADPYAPDEITADAETGEVKGGEFYHGLVYSNATGDPDVNLTLEAKAGDKITFISSSNGGAATYGFMVEEAGGQTGEGSTTEETTKNYTVLAEGSYAPEGNVNAVPLTFYAPADGTYTYAVIDQEKLVVCRIYRESGVKTTVTGTVDQSLATGLTGEYSVVFTGPGGVVTKAPVKDGKYTIELNNYLTGADYVVSLEGADGYIVASGEEFSLERVDRTGTHDIIVAAVDLITVTGKVAGLAEADLANVKLTITKPEDKIYQPKIVPAADGSFTAKFEKGVTYDLTALNVNDYELAKDQLTFTADKAENVVFVPKTTYAITMVPDPADVDLSAATIIFTNKDEVDDAHKDGYVYTFTGAEGIKLRDAQYVVEVKGAPGIQKLTPDLLVAGADTDCPVPFNVQTPTLWDFSDATWTSQSGLVEAYNGLVMSGVQVNKTYALGGKEGSILVPVDGNCTVAVSYCYAANGTVGDVPFSTESGSTGTIETTSYKYTGDKGTVEIKTSDTSYLTKIEVITATPYSETVRVGADKEYKTINEALAAVKTMERTAEQRVTILIDPGDYEEMLRINTPNVTFKNASATPSIALKNKGVDIDANAVRITSYYGHGYAYYSMDKDCSYNEELLAVNKANGKLSFENPGTGTTSGSYWNATVRVMASGIQAEGIIFENSFNQYVSKKAANDVIVPIGGAKEGAVPRAEMKAGDTTVQHKEYVERAAALAIDNNCKEIFFDNCRFVGRQDTLYGGVDSTVGFYNCAVMGGTDYIFGGMNAVFAKCDLVFNTNDETEKGQKDDVGYITAPQQSSGRGYLMYNCHVTSTTPGVDTASNMVSKPGTFGRPWAAKSGEAVFYATNVDATDPVYYTGDTAKGTSMIQGGGWLSTLSGESGLCGDFDTVEYFEGADTTADRASWAAKFTEAKTADGASMTDAKAWLGGWDAFAGKDMTVVKQTPKPFDAATLKDELVKAIANAKGIYDVAPDTMPAGTAAADVDRGTEFVYESDKTALNDAIAAAQAVVDNDSATVADVLAAQKALSTAVKTFVNAKKTGTKAPDTTALQASLDAAAAAKAGVVVTSGPADKVAKDVAFAPKTAFDALNAAIKAAQTVADSTSATQKDVNDAKAALDAAITAFNAAKGVGTKAADAASLKAAIEEAKAAKDAVVVNAGPADQVDAGTKFVTDQAVIDALDAAIKAAQAVADKANATQAELDAALKALTIAKADFDASVQTGTKGGGTVGPDKTALADAIAEAEGVYAIGSDVKVMPAGTQASAVDKGQKFVTQDVYDALAAAIEAAKAVLADPNATEEDIAKAVADLNAAKEAFKVQTGTKGTGGGGNVSGGTASTGTTTTTKTNANGDTVKKTTDRNGKVTYVVTSKDGEVLATVELPATIPALTKKFKDVPDDHWAANSINDLAALGMVKGVADEIYDMVSPVTRGSLATILFRLAQGKDGYANDFSDVAAGTWYTDAVGWAAKTGVVNGFEDGTFRPDNSITREQLVVMLYRFAKLLALDTSAEGSLASFTDGTTTSDWAKEAMVWAVGAGIVKGDDAKAINPTAAASRAETACMVDRFLGLMK